MLGIRLRFAITTIAAVLAILPASSQALRRAPHQRAAVVAYKASECVGADLAPTPTNLAEIRSATLCLVNVERTQRGRSALRSNGELASAAGTYARAMVDYSFFGHFSPAGSTFVARIKRTSYLTRSAGWALGENLAWGEAELGSPAATVTAWMLSPEHKRNILDGRYVEIGVGVVYGTPGGGAQTPGATYATEFGSRVLLTPA